MILHMTKIYSEEIISILLPKVRTPIMTNSFKVRILARLPKEDQQGYVDTTSNTLTIILKYSYKANKNRGWCEINK